MNTLLQIVFYVYIKFEENLNLFVISIMAQDLLGNYSQSYSQARAPITCNPASQQTNMFTIYFYYSMTFERSLYFRSKLTYLSTFTNQLTINKFERKKNN